MQRAFFVLVCALSSLSTLPAGLGGSASVSGTQAAGPGRPPEGLSEGDWTSIGEAYQQSRHAIHACEGGFRSTNPGQRWQAFFDGRGSSVRPDGLGWEWGLELVSYGFAGAEMAVAEPQATSAVGQRVAYDWDEALEEWYVNDARGLEHGFTVRERPARGADAPGPLRFTLAVRGELVAELDADARGARFLGAAGAPALTYSGLTAFDADGARLDARLERVEQGLRIVVDERGARYPLTIDPLVQQAYLKASNTGSGDEFGTSVAISGNTVVVGARSEDSDATGVNGNQASNAAPRSGAAYVFVRDGSGWSQEAYLKASNTEADDLFGWAVAISGDTIVVSAEQEASDATGVNGDQSNNDAPFSGAAYVFVHDGTTWTQQAYLKASNTGELDAFGISLAISGDVLVVGAFFESSSATGVNGDQSNDEATFSGAAYVFRRNARTWSQEAYLKASNTGPGDQFGRALAVEGDVVVSGAIGEASSATGVGGNEGNDEMPGSGAVYVFVHDGIGWSQQAYVKASNTGPGDNFGGTVAISGGVMLVGASREDSSATGVGGDQSDESASDSGAAYVFRQRGTGWSQEAYLKASNTGPLDRFGFGAVACDTIVVGAFGEDSNATGIDGDQINNSAIDSGAAYVFARGPGGWAQTAYLKPLDSFHDQFGIDVALAAGTLLIGAPNDYSSATGVNGDPTVRGASSSGAAYVYEVGVQAAAVFRNAGSNPASYAASPIRIGMPFTATVDNNLAGQVSSLLFAFDSPVSFVLGGGQVLLCNDTGSGEIFTGLNLAPSSSAGGIDTYSLLVPNDCALAGFAFFSQAIQLGNAPFALSNAQDFTVGNPF